MVSSCQVEIQGPPGTDREVNNRSLLECAPAVQPAPFAVLDGCNDCLGVIMDAVALRTVGRDIAVELVATAGQRLLGVKVSLKNSHKS